MLSKFSSDCVLFADRILQSACARFKFIGTACRTSLNSRIQAPGDLAIVALRRESMWAITPGDRRSATRRKEASRGPVDLSDLCDLPGPKIMNFMLH